MKVKVGLTSDEVEVGQYREMNKGSLKGFFALVIYPRGQKILDCRYFVQGDKRWISFPQKEIKYNDGRKPEFIPYVSYLDKEYLEQLKIAVLTALKEVTDGQTQNSSNQKQSGSVSDEAPFGWGKPPF